MTGMGVAMDDAGESRIAEGQRDNPDSDVFFLDDHAESAAIAFDDLYYLERACRQQILAQSTGLPPKPIESKMVRETQQSDRADLRGACRRPFRRVVAVPWAWLKSRVPRRRAATIRTP